MPLTFQPPIGGGTPLATTLPMTETVQPLAGTSEFAARADHSHRRPTSAEEGTLGADGTCTLTFTRTFAQKPSITLTYEESADSQPVTLRVRNWIQDPQGVYLGCVVKGTRPNMAVATVLGISVAIGGPTGGVVTGLQFTYIAVMRTIPAP